MGGPINIDAINIRKQLILTDDGKTYPFASIYDDDGCEVDDIDDATYAVVNVGAGWITVIFSDYDVKEVRTNV